MKQLKNTRFFLAAVSASAALMLAGCGGDQSADSAAEETTRPATPSTESANKATPQPSREIVVAANDQMKFSKTEIVVAPGETVKLTLNNEGTMPKFSMGHNLVIIKRAADPIAFAEAAATAPANDYIPPSKEAEVIAHTAMLGGGESDSVIFTAPDAKGDYPFLCSFPGHVQAGMRGVMKVQ